MKKLILVFAIFMAYTVTSFAYSEYYSVNLTGVDSQIIRMSTPSGTVMGYDMHVTANGYVLITIYDIYRNVLLTDRVNYLGGYGSGASGSCNGLLGGYEIEVVIYDPEGEANGNGINWGWYY